MRFRYRVLSLLALATLVACASIPAKQRVSNTHQAVRQSIVILDEEERAACGPRPDAPNTCGNPAAATIGLTDAKHQALSRSLVQALDLDEKVGVAVIAWRAGDPPPADLATLVSYAQDIANTASTLTDQALIARAQTVLARLQALVETFTAK